MKTISMNLNWINWPMHVVRRQQSNTYKTKMPRFSILYLKGLKNEHEMGRLNSKNIYTRIDKFLNPVVVPGYDTMATIFDMKISFRLVWTWPSQKMSLKYYAWYRQEGMKSKKKKKVKFDDETRSFKRWRWQRDSWFGRQRVFAWSTWTFERRPTSRAAKKKKEKGLNQNVNAHKTPNSLTQINTPIPWKVSGTEQVSNHTFAVVETWNQWRVDVTVRIRIERKKYNWLEHWY